MKKEQIKFRIMLLLLGIGVFYGLVLILFTPFRTRQHGRDILFRDARLVSGLLSESLVSTLQETEPEGKQELERKLNAIKEMNENYGTPVSGIGIYDENKEFVHGINYNENEAAQTERDDNVSFDDSKNSLTAWVPIRNNENRLLGYAHIDFSKNILNSSIMRNTLYSLLIGVIVLAGIFLTGNYLLPEIIDEPINKLVENIKSIAAEKDLSKEIDGNFSEEIGVLSVSFNEVLQSVNKTLSDILGMANQINDSVMEMSVTVGEQAEIILQQDESVNNTTSAVEELSVTANQIEESAVEVSNQIETSAQKVAFLSEKANQIGKVISTIEYITEKIDNLSLNASIEAARAGEQGKSFAVVASEIRKLAENTSKSTEDIITLIEDIQNSTADAVLSTEQAVDYVKRIKLSIQQHNIGTQQADSAMTVINEGMNRTSEGINKVVDYIEGIDSKVKEMKNFIAKLKTNSQS